MHLAQRAPSYVEKMVVVDMGIKEYPMHHQNVIDAVESLSLKNIKARREVHAIFRESISEEALIQFLLKNLYWVEKGVLAWRMNMSVLEASMDDILSALPSGEVLVPCLFIRGGASNYVLNEDIPQIEIQFPDSEFVTIDKAGHWVHSEAPEEFNQFVLSYLLR